MEKIFLDIQSRQVTGSAKAKALRREGIIPANIYMAGKKAEAIKVSRSEFIRLVHQHHLESMIINLRTKDEKKERSRPCLIKEIQYEPVKGDILHIDFNEISLTEKIKVKIPIVTKGEAIGVKQEAGSLEQILWEIEIECLPSDIPKDIEVEVSGLKMGDSIHVKDITFAANIKVLNEPEAVVVQVVAPVKKEEVVPAVEGVELGEPEVIKEKKPEAEGEGEAEKKEAKKEVKREVKKEEPKKEEKQEKK